jgi:hypothetical protein
MKNIFFAILVAIGLASCDKTPESYPLPSYYWGNASALLNGQNWIGHPFAGVHINNIKGFSININVLDGSNIYKLEELNFAQIPFVPGKYALHNPVPGVNDDLTRGAYFILDDDVTLGNYIVLESDSSSFITLMSYDSLAKEVKGTFDVTFIVDHKARPDSPDTIRFKNGQFHTKFVN